MRLLALVVTTTLILAANASAAAGKCSDDRACCLHNGSATVQDPEVAPVREYAKVTFHSPVKIGTYVLMGTYVIEHDTERMARGEPCTHIYEADDWRLPIVAFHCVHMDRARNDGPNATVTLRRLPDMTTRIFELVEFQFAGSPDGHRVPAGR